MADIRRSIINIILQEQLKGDLSKISKFIYNLKKLQRNEDEWGIDEEIKAMYINDKLEEYLKEYFIRTQKAPRTIDVKILSGGGYDVEDNLMLTGDAEFGIYLGDRKKALAGGIVYFTGDYIDEDKIYISAIIVTIKEINKDVLGEKRISMEQVGSGIFKRSASELAFLERLRKMKDNPNEEYHIGENVPERKIDFKLEQYVKEYLRKYASAPPFIRVIIPVGGHATWDVEEDNIYGSANFEVYGRNSKDELATGVVYFSGFCLDEKTITIDVISLEINEIYEV